MRRELPSLPAPSRPAQSSSRFPIAKWAFAIGLFLTLFASLDLGIGYFASTRILAKLRPAASSQATAGSNAVVTTAERLHHGLEPRIDCETEWGPEKYRLRTDSLGFKSRAVQEVQLTNNAYRIVFLGDSFTEGVGVPAEQTYAGVVETELSGPGRGIEVFNAGVQSYSPKLYFLKTVHCWENLGFRFNEAWVFIDPSDVADELIYSDFTPRGFAHELPLLKEFKFERVQAEPGFFERSICYRTWMRLVIHHDPWRRAVYRDVKGGSSFDYYGQCDGWILDDQLYETWGRMGLQSASYYMAQLATYLRDRGVRLGIAVYPRPNEIQARNRNSRNENFWRDFARQHDLPFLDLYPSFISDAPGAMLAERFIKHDVHWNARGHEAVARAWLEYRRSLSMFPKL